MKYTYQEVIDHIQNARRFGSLTGYETSKCMLEKLGSPQEGLPFVHVAGTNGKGSTTAFLCKILEQTGLKIGMFTSPHLVTFEERIRINGNYIDKAAVTRLGNLLLSTDFEVYPTMFDYCLCMAILYFKEQQCDIVVMETGIGGRYDSTNALGNPLVSVITKIGMDHTAILGDSLEKIAYEKAGIMKPGCPVVIQRQQEEVRHVLLENFRTVNMLEDDQPLVHAEQAKKDAVTSEPSFHEVSEEDLHCAAAIPMKMHGTFQIENAATAIVAAREILSGRKMQEKLQLTEEKLQDYIHKGISETYWKGRMELLNEEPFFMIDGAHNSHGVHALAESLKALYPGEKFHFIMGVMADKDYEEMIEELLPLALDFVTVTPESNRALQADELARCIETKGVTASYAEDMETLIRPYLAKKNSMECHATMGKTIAFGSLYFIGAIEAMVE